MERSLLAEYATVRWRWVRLEGSRPRPSKRRLPVRRSLFKLRRVVSRLRRVSKVRRFSEKQYVWFHEALLGGDEGATCLSRGSGWVRARRPSRQLGGCPVPARSADVARRDC